MVNQALSQSLIVARIGFMHFKSTREAVVTVAGFPAFSRDTATTEVNMPSEGESGKVEMHELDPDSITVIMNEV
jgi:hypothetical protein